MLCGLSIINDASKCGQYFFSFHINKKKIILKFFVDPAIIINKRNIFFKNKKN